MGAALAAGCGMRVSHARLLGSPVGKNLGVGGSRRNFQRTRVLREAVFLPPPQIGSKPQKRPVGGWWPLYPPLLTQKLPQS